MVQSLMWRSRSSPWSCLTGIISSIRALSGISLKLGFFRLRKYITYWLDAVDEHSLHAPFLYNFYKNVFCNDPIDKDHQRIESLREILKKDAELINLQDLGAGSFQFQKSSRKISDIARTSLSPAKYCRLYQRIANYLECTNILEIGTSLGISTMYLSLASNARNVVSIEGSGTIAQIATKNFESLYFENIQVVVDSADDCLKPVLKDLNSVDLVFIDANHTFESTMRYVNWCMEFCHENSVVIIDDIYWSPEMSKAWKCIRNNPKPTLTLDIYKAGIVLFKPGIQKENYVLRF